MRPNTLQRLRFIEAELKDLAASTHKQVQRAGEVLNEATADDSTHYAHVHAQFWAKADRETALVAALFSVRRVLSSAGGE